MSVQTSDADEKLYELAARIDEFEGYSNPHARRVARLAAAVAENFGFSGADLLALRQAALIHDIGELSMNRDYIRADRPLTPDERTDLQRHPVIGEQEAAKIGLSRAAQQIVRWHHEWWNGAGYPDAIAREQIPLAARILRAADAYAAMTDARPFRAAETETEARKYLIEWSGIAFDPRVVNAFLALKDVPETRSFADEKAEAAESKDDAAQPISSNYA